MVFSSLDPVWVVIMRRAQSSKSNLRGPVLRTRADHPRLRLLLALLTIAGGLISTQLARAADCPPGPQNAGPVASVTDGRTLILADGRTVRLAMIEVPALPPVGSAPQHQATAGDRTRN